MIALSHNPDGARESTRTAPMDPRRPHARRPDPRAGVRGGDVERSQYKFQQGEFKLGHGTLYVSRGVGYLKQIRVFCRPEIHCFVVESRRRESDSPLSRSSGTPGEG